MQKLFTKVLIRYVIASYLFFSFVQLDPAPFLGWSMQGRTLYAVITLLISFITATIIHDRKK